MHTRLSFMDMGSIICVSLLATLACLPISGCAQKPVQEAQSAQYVQSAPAQMPVADPQSGQEVKTPLPPPQIESNQSQPALIEASPKFPTLPDWNTTIWDISSP